MKLITSLFLVLFLLLQYRLWIGNGSLTEVHHLRSAKIELAEENNRLVERNQSLAAEVLDLKQGQEAIEERARSEMGMIKTDETVFQIIDNNPSELVKE
jgi:cell division protein FtsB